MQVYLADCRLEYAWLLFARYLHNHESGAWQKARDCLSLVDDYTETEKARDGSKPDTDVRYRRKDEEIELLQKLVSETASSSSIASPLVAEDEVSSEHQE